MRLRELQEAFQRYVIDLDPGMAEFIAERPGAPAVTRLDIYAEAYRLRLVEVLGEYFPGLRGCVGEEEFDRMAVNYIDRHPSIYFSVRRFGDRLGEYLAGASPYRERPALAEMARFESALADAFDAADAPTVKQEELVEVPPERWPDLSFSFQAGTQLLKLRYNVVAVWKAVTAGGRPPKLRRGPNQAWLIWRRDLNPRFRLLSDLEAGILDAALRGRNFAHLCELLSERLPTERVPSEAAGFLNRWVEENLIARIEPPAAIQGAPASTA